MAKEHKEDSNPIEDRVSRRTLLKTIPASTISGVGFATSTTAHGPIDAYRQTVAELERLGEHPGQPSPERWYQQVQSQLQTLRRLGDRLVEQGHQMQVTTGTDELQIRILEPDESASDTAPTAPTNETEFQSPRPSTDSFAPNLSVDADPTGHAVFREADLNTEAAKQSGAMHHQPLDKHRGVFASTPPDAAQAMTATPLAVVGFGMLGMTAVTSVGLLMLTPYAASYVASGAASLVSYLGGAFPSVPAMLNELYASHPYVFLFFSSSLANPEMRVGVGCSLGSKVVDRISEYSELARIAQIIGDLSGGCDVTLIDVAEYAQERFLGTPPDDGPSPPSRDQHFSFETASPGSPPADPWYVQNVPDSNAGVEVATDMASDGEQSLHMWSYRDDLEITRVGIDLDLTEITSLTYDAYNEASNANWGDVKVNLDGMPSISDDTTGEPLDNTLVDGFPPEDRWYTDIEVDLSPYTGEHTLVFWVRGDRNDVYWDNIRFQN